MELTKTYKVRKCSHNKLTKKQLTALRSQKWILFERSYQNVMERLTYCKAFMRTYKDVTDMKQSIFCHSWERVRRMYEFMQNQFMDELKALDIVRSDAHYLCMVGDRKARNFKISI